MIAIDPETAAEFLTGIANHARAGNFDQAAIQAQSVIAAMETAASDEPGRVYASALPLVRQIPALAEHSDRAAILDRVHEAVKLLKQAEE